MKLMNMMNEERMDGLIFDYIEGEMDPSMKADFQNLLLKDESLQKRVRDLGGVRKQMKDLDFSPDMEARLQAKIAAGQDALHDRIMAQIGKSKPKSRWVVIATEAQSWKSAAAVTFALLATLAILKVVNPQTGAQFAALGGSAQHRGQAVGQVTGQTTVGQMMVDASIRSPEVVGEEGLSSEDDIDMYMDIMAKRMGKMDDRQNKEIMDNLKQ